MIQTGRLSRKKIWYLITTTIELRKYFRFCQFQFHHLCERATLFLDNVTLKMQQLTLINCLQLFMSLQQSQRPEPHSRGPCGCVTIVVVVTMGWTIAGWAVTTWCCVVVTTGAGATYWKKKLFKSLILFSKINFQIFIELMLYHIQYRINHYFPRCDEKEFDQ